MKPNFARCFLALVLQPRWLFPSPLTPAFLQSVAFKAVVALSLMGSNGACLYSNQINMPPTVTIEDPGPVFHGSSATFKATVGDSDGSSISLAWASGSGPCTDDGFSALLRVPASDGAGEFTIAELGVTPVCVWAFATDNHGAEARAHRDVVPGDRAPTVSDIRIVRPDPLDSGKYPLFGEIKFAAEGMDDPDGDQVTASWQVIGPGPATSSAISACVDDLVADGSPCFVPIQPGEYQFKLTLTSSPQAGVGGAASMTTTKTKTFVVAEDRLPCLDQTVPEISTPVTVVVTNRTTPISPFVLAVKSVSDDGDPYPANPVAVGPQGETKFSWYEGADTGPLEFKNVASSSYEIDPLQHRAGDKIRVRVEIRDRNASTINAMLAGCGDQTAFCPQTGTCFQRATWTVLFK